MQVSRTRRPRWLQITRVLLACLALGAATGAVAERAPVEVSLRLGAADRQAAPRAAAPPAASVVVPVAAPHAAPHPHPPARGALYLAHRALLL